MRLCVPNDPSVTNVAGKYLLFDIEVDLVYDTFTTYPNTTFPGRVDVDGDLLNCWCEPQCDCCCPDGQILDVCGMCEAPPSVGSACNCTQQDEEQGNCIPCQITSSTSSDSVRLCHFIRPGVYELVDVNICNVRQYFAQFPRTVYPGYFGIDANFNPLALDCFCQPPPITTPPAVEYCLNITEPCDGGTPPFMEITTDGFYCLRTSNSSLVIKFACNEAGDSFETYSCPFGCGGVCVEDPFIKQSLGLEVYDGRLSNGGFCASSGTLPMIPTPAQMQCVPGMCEIMTMVFTTTSSTTLPPTSTTMAPPTSTPATTGTTGTTTSTIPTTSTSTSTTTEVTTTPVDIPEGCLSIFGSCDVVQMDLAMDGTYCSVISTPLRQYSFKMNCNIFGSIVVSVCTDMICSEGCVEDPTMLLLLGLENVNASSPGVCTMTNINIPGIPTTSVYLTCPQNCPVTTTPPGNEVFWPNIFLIII